MSASCPVLRSPPPQLKRRFVSANVDHFERISNAGVVPKALQFEACNVFDLFGHTKKPVAASASRYRRRRGAPRGMTLNSSRRTFSFCESYNTKTPININRSTVSRIKNSIEFYTHQKRLFTQIYGRRKSKKNIVMSFINFIKSRGAVSRSCLFAGCRSFATQSQAKTSFR